METIKEQQEFINEINDETPLSTQLLKEYGFTCERKPLSDVDGLWYNSFYIQEDHYDGTFAFAVYMRGDKSFKSGYTVDTLGRLKALYFGVTNRMLTKAPPEPIPNKL